MSLSELARLGAAACGTAAAYAVARRVYDDISLRALERKTFNAKLHAFQQREAMRTLQRLEPDVNGRGGWMVRPDGTIVNLDTHSRLDAQWAVSYVDPLRERVDTIERLLLAAANIKSDTAPLLGAVEPVVHPFAWPTEYEYIKMARKYLKRPSHHNVLLGVTYDEQGSESPVIADMEELIHIMIGGRSGFGKSNLEYVVARQLVDSIDDCRLAFIDYAGMTLKPLEHSDRVLWPTATNDETALPVLRGIVQELEHRKSLFADCPGVQKLSQYNALDDREPLVPWYLFLDETSQCLRNKALAEMLTVISEQARKFGLGIVGAGTTWHAKYAPEPFRVNFSTRAAVYCSRHTSGVILEGDYSASELERPGQAVIMLPGHTGTTRMLCPEAEFDVVKGGGPLYKMPATEAKAVELSEQEKAGRVLELHQKEFSNRQIELDVFGYAGGRATERVRQIIESATT